MKTKTLLQTTGLTIMMMLLNTFYSNAQIQLQGLAVNHEGVACWDANGSGPEPEAYGHEHPFGWGSSLYYSASRDYIDPDPDAAMCHFLDNIIGFPQFVQALSDNGFTAGQVKIKTGLFELNNDIEGEDWFTIDSAHYYNRYGGDFTIELNGEPMIYSYVGYNNIRNISPNSSWQCETDFNTLVDVSENSSAEVQAVAIALLADVGNEEVRLKLNVTGATSFGGNGRVDGAYFNITSGSLEKGLPELPFEGLAADHEGFACWDADGSGAEPQAYGHNFWWGGFEYSTPYYLASCNYDDIDPDPNAATCHFLEGVAGFANLKIQLDYRGYTLDQLKLKSGLCSLGNDVEGEDWSMIGDIHSYNHYGTPISFEIDGEPILEYLIDTNFSSHNMNNLNWMSTATFAKVINVSANASEDAQYVAASFLKDLGGHSIGSIMEGHYAGVMPQADGREGVFQEIENGKLIARQPAGTHIWENEVSGTWDLARSPFIVMGALEIPDGETLEIEHGVVVKFNTTGGLNVQGCLLAEGTAEQPILFKAVNQNVRWGGLMWDQTPVNNDSSVVKHCIFEYAYSYETEPGYNCGGALRTNVDRLKISHCIFRNNLADNMLPSNSCGGAIAIFECSPHISHCIFYNNSSPWGGALAVCSNSNPVIDNCLFYDNESTYNGGGGGAVLIWTESNPHFVNCTFADNYAVDAGGAVEVEINSAGTFTNCIFWGNKTNSDPNSNQISVWDLAESSLNVYYCDVEDGLNGITPGFEGEYLFNIDEDPGFLGAEGVPYYALDGGSACVNGGTANTLYLPVDYIFPEFCLEGNPRQWEGIDMGAYEFYDVGVSDPTNIDKGLFNIFPNPINSNPSIEFYLNNESVVHLTILDIHGRIISEMETQQLKKGTNRITWNAEKISAGLYFCQLQIGNKVSTSKLIKLN